MDSLPLETIIEIAKCDVQAYRALVLAYPVFARWVARVTIYEVMPWFGHDVKVECLVNTLQKTTAMVWRRHGMLHRLDGPATAHPNVAERWYRNGKQHRVGGPAIVWVDGTQEWYQHGEKHRDDGPAYVAAGYRSWWAHDKRHRDDGPAIVCANGTEEYWVNGVKTR